MGLGFGASFLNLISEYHLYSSSVEIGPYRKQKKKKDENLGGSGWLTANKLTVVRRLDFAFVFPTLGLCCGSGTKLEPRGRGVTTIQIERVEKKQKN